jgi:hypothetical protein
MLSATPGIVTPSFATLALYHPQFALAIANGVPKRPNNRTLTFTFSSTAVPQNPQPASFDEFISSYSVFAGFDYTIDPTSAFSGNVLKTLSDTMQKQVSGFSMQLTVRANGSDYSPIPADTMLQLVPSILNPTAGMWSMNNPDNVKAQLTMQSSPPAAPLTVQCVFSFIVLGDGGQRYLCMSEEAARDALCKMNVPGLSGA